MPAADPYRCICNPDLAFDRESVLPYAALGCPAHRARRCYQQFIMADLVTDRAADIITEQAWEEFDAGR